MSTFSGFNCARDGVLTSPALLNNRSDGDISLFYLVFSLFFVFFWVFRCLDFGKTEKPVFQKKPGIFR